MTYETYHFIFVAAAVLAGVFLAIAAILFVILKIPRVVGDLSGVTAKKAIQSIREQNEQPVNKVYKSSKVNRKHDTLTEKITPQAAPINVGMDETTILTQNMVMSQYFEIEQDITFIHTEEQITL